jgi:hypothetical protein
MHLSSHEALDLIEARATEEQIRFWDAHLAGCPACRNQLADSFAEPALAGARGALSGRQFLLAAEGIDIHIRMWNHGTERRINGQILSRDQHHVVSSARIHLMSSDQRAVTTNADEFGEFEFKEVPEGPLQIQVELPQLIVTGPLSPG